MREIFGLPMSTVLVILVGLFSVFLLSVALIAWRRPVLFKLGVRNIPRRRAQSTLIVIGLMLSTLIISAALGVGDTLNHSISAEVYRQAGHIDAMVLRSPDADADIMTGMMETIDAEALGIVETTYAGDERVDGIMPVLDARVPVMHEAAGQSEPNVVLTGLDPARLDAFGGLLTVDGEAIDLAAMPEGQVVLTAKTAETLDAAAGDTVTIFYNNAPTTLQVYAVSQDSTLAGWREEAMGMVMPLARLQAFTGQEGSLTGIFLSTTGGVRNGDTDTREILADLAPALEGQMLGSTAVKMTSVEGAESVSGLFTSLFLVLGLFSVSAGVMLIVLIFTMLAAERRSEMGMARAVGTHRRQLVQKFVSEGSAYAILAGLVGAAMGVLATFGIAAAMGALVGDMVTIEPKVTLRSLVVAYSLGMVITFITVIGSSWKVSRLNIVAAVRDIPDAVVATRKKSGLVWGIVFLALGGLLTVQGLAGDTAFAFYTGMSLLPLGVARVARFFGAAARPVYSFVGLALLALWMLPMDVAEDLFGTLDGDMEMFFLSGIFMVIGATVLIVHNTDLLLAAISRLGGVFRGALPAVRTAVAYPGAAAGRTGMTIAMFSLIIFSLVMMSTMNANYANYYLSDETNAGWHVRVDTSSANPVDDFTGTLEASGVETDGFTAVGTLTSPSPFGSDVREAGTGAWRQVSVNGMDAGFIDGTTLAFPQRAAGYDSDEAIIEALRTQPDVAVISAWYLADSQATSMNGEDTMLKLSSVSSADAVFEPAQVDLARPDGSVTTVTVIGVIDDGLGILNGLYTSQATIEATYPQTATTSYYVALDDAETATDVAQGIEAALMYSGAQGTSIRDDLEAQQQQEAGFLYLVQGFMGLGLFVGVAAVGVIAFRSVVERRQQIGVLRALGFQRRMVSLSFLIETAFIVGIGVAAGVGLGVVLARNMFTADASVAEAGFSVPWMTIGVIAVATVAIALGMTWMPSRQAARIAPAEALRYE